MIGWSTQLKHDLWKWLVELPWFALLVINNQWKHTVKTCDLWLTRSKNHFGNTARQRKGVKASSNILAEVWFFVCFEGCNLRRNCRRMSPRNGNSKKMLIEILMRCQMTKKGKMATLLIVVVKALTDYEVSSYPTPSFLRVLKNWWRLHCMWEQLWSQHWCPPSHGLITARTAFFFFLGGFMSSWVFEGFS